MSQSQSADKLSNNHDLKPIYVRSIVNSFGPGTVSPFLSVYAVKLGAFASEMGWFQSVSNLAPNMMQVPWGKLYALSAIGRGVGVLTFTALKEPYKYPSTLRKEFSEIMHKLPLIPERGSTQP